MIIFVGSEAKGFFVEEIAEKRKEKFAYVESKSRILQQSYEILSYEGVEHMVSVSMRILLRNSQMKL